MWLTIHQAGESKPYKKHQSAQHDTANGDNLKRKRDTDGSKEDPKLQEFLDVMQHASKTRTWANDDIIPAATVAPAVVQSDETGQAQLPRPLKKPKVHQPETVAQVSQNEVTQASAENDQLDEDAKSNGDVSAKEEEQPKSDMDWLRSKTSRLLGLLDEDEQTESKPEPEMDTFSSPAELPDESENDEAEETPIAQEPVGEKDYDADIELIRKSGRLFLRNLAYDATEADLKSIFAPFGKIDEVSTFYRSFPLPPSSSSTYSLA